MFTSTPPLLSHKTKNNPTNIICLQSSRLIGIPSPTATCASKPPHCHCLPSKLNDDARNAMAAPDASGRSPAHRSVGQV